MEGRFFKVDSCFPVAVSVRNDTAPYVNRKAEGSFLMVLYFFYDKNIKNVRKNVIKYVFVRKTGYLSKKVR